MLLLDYYISPDYNSLLNIRQSLLEWCKSNSFLLKHESKTLHYTENINISIPDCITVQKYFRRQLINTFPIREDFLYLCTKNFFPFKGLQLQQGIIVFLVFYTVAMLQGQHCGKPTDQPFIVGIFLSHFELGFRSEENLSSSLEATLETGGRAEACLAKWRHAI